MIRYLSHPDQHDDVSPLISIDVIPSVTIWFSATSINEALDWAAQSQAPRVTVFSPGSGSELPLIEAEYRAGDRRIPIPQA